MPTVTQQPRAAVFLVRAWWEDGQFRARISYYSNIHSEPATETQIVTADPDEVRRHLALWLTEATTTAGSKRPLSGEQEQQS
jgi:hypothetical protein